GYDLVVVANVSQISVSNPMISFGGGALQALKIHGLGSDQALTTLKPGEVWATLVPQTVTTVSVSISTTVANSVNSLTNASLTTTAGADVQYIRVSRPSLTTQSFNGFNAIAAEPAATGSTNVDHIFGVSTDRNALIVVNAADGSQRQLFKDGQNGV